MSNSIALIILIAVAIVAIVIVGIRSAKTPQKLRSVETGTATLKATRVIAVLWTGAVIVGTLFAILTTLLSDTVPVHLPVQAFWPEAYPTTDLQRGDTVATGSPGFTSADVIVSGLDVFARVWLAFGHLAQGGTSVVVGIAVFLLCSRLLKNEPFREVLSAPARLAATAVIIGGLAWQICFGIGSSLASSQALGSFGYGYDENEVARALDPDMPVIGLVRSTTDFSIDFWPIAAGLALLAISAAFRHSERLQRDTAGLV